MKHRHWLLALPMLTLAYWLVLSVSPLLGVFGWLVMSDDRSMMVLSLGLLGLACWTAMEITNTLTLRRGHRCECGYALKGLQCPECGKPLGGGHRG